MESSRDSSVWRSLAVTFGGGLALGAVGMRLTQTALRPVEIPPRPDTNPAADRLSSLERRLERMEQAPASARPSAAAPTAAAPIDQKVLEAVVGAVDARLHEHAGIVDRRLADMEARIAVELQALHRQDGLNFEAGQQQLAKIETQFHQEAKALRAVVEQDVRQFGETVTRVVAGQAATQAELQTLDQQRSLGADASQQRFAGIEQQLGETVSRVAAGQAATQAELQAVHQHRSLEADASQQRFAGIERQLGEMVSRVAAGQAAVQAELQAVHQQHSLEAEASQQRFAGIERQLGETVSRVVAGQAAVQAELQAVHQQSERIVDAAEQRFADMRFEYRQEMADLRTAVDGELGQLQEKVADQAAAQEQRGTELRAAMERTVASQVETRTAALEQSLEARIVTAAAVATAAQLEERLAPLRAEVQLKERELAALRQRLAESERSVLDVVLAIGQICRQAADRIEVSPKTGSAPEAYPDPAAAPTVVAIQPTDPLPAQTAPESPLVTPVAPSVAMVQPAEWAVEQCAPETSPAPVIAPIVVAADPTPTTHGPMSLPTIEMLPGPMLAADRSPAPAVPDFLHEAGGNHNWRVPLVSSFLLLVTTGCLALLHYL